MIKTIDREMISKMSLLDIVIHMFWEGRIYDHYRFISDKYLEYWKTKDDFEDFFSEFKKELSSVNDELLEDKISDEDKIKFLNAIENKLDADRKEIVAQENKAIFWAMEKIESDSEKGAADDILNIF